MQTFASAYQPGCPIVDLLEVRRQWDLLDAESDPCKAELACDVHAADLHVHGHDLHGAHAPADRRAQHICTGPVAGEQHGGTLRRAHLSEGTGRAGRDGLSGDLAGRDSRPHKQSQGSPLLNGMQELLEGSEGRSLAPDAQAAHVYHVAGL